MNANVCYDFCATKCYYCNDVCDEPCQYTKKIRIPGEGGRTWVHYCSKICSIIEQKNPLRVGELGNLVYQFDGVSTAVTSIRLFKKLYHLSDDDIQKIPYYTTGSRKMDAIWLQETIRYGRES